MTISAFPLQWPVAWKRTEPAYRREARFGRARKKYGEGYVPFREVSVSEAVERVLEQLRHMAILRDDVVLSTNVRTRLDGLPRGGDPEPSDPGAAVYWQESTGARRVMAIDLYDRVAGNLAAIAATLEAMRSIERHGGAAVLERAFTGFVALPAPNGARHWREVLDLHPATHIDATDLTTAYRRAAAKTHPDKGGTAAAFSEVGAAYESAKRELGL